MCVWYSYAYQKGVLCFLIHEYYIRFIKRYCFVRKYAAVPVQRIIIIIIIIIMSLVTGLFFLAILLNQQ
jgi:hypothetical protein